MMDWQRLSDLPRVSPWRKGTRSYTWEQRRDDYAALPKVPIIITAELATPVLPAERDWTHLDSILTFAALTSHPAPSAYDKPPVVPLPLELAWVSPGGLPLWACTPLRPSGDWVETSEYWHKRYPIHRADLASKANAILTAGRWKEYRMPVRAQSASKLHALAIGNADEVQRLLSFVAHIGKKGSVGYGRVVRWSVTPGAHTIDDVLALRPVPVAYYDGQCLVGTMALHRGWTPPYWYSPWWADCIVPSWHHSPIFGEGAERLLCATK